MTMMNLRGAAVATILVAFVSAHPVSAQNIKALVQKIHSVGKEGKGNVAAAQALQKLSQHDAAVLPAILTAMNDANPIAVNYLRAAFETIADRTLTEKKNLPTAKLRAFLDNIKHDGAARRLAFEWLVRIEPSTPERLLPTMLDDPSAELRRDAVARILKDAKRHFDKKDKIPARQLYQKALKYARDRDQVEVVASQLEKLGDKIDLTKHFGFLTHWHVIAPFDSTGGIGFAKSYPPDEKVELAATYSGKKNKKAQWQAHTTDKKLGTVDFNDIFGAWHGVVAYAYTTVRSARARPIEIRASSNNAIVMYLNGKKIYSREEYHHGVRMDQHMGKGMLRAGENTILVKVCQNEQEETWAQQWSFNLRVTDHLGAKVPILVDNAQSGKK